jgi:hypothetical protein
MQGIKVLFEKADKRLAMQVSYYLEKMTVGK